jgi:hypothetical protein
MDGKDDVAEAPANGTCSNNGCDQGEGAVPKTASQLKKEAKRLAKLEKFTKKQNQMASKDGASNEVRTLIYFFKTRRHRRVTWSISLLSTLFNFYLQIQFSFFMCLSSY